MVNLDSKLHSRRCAILSQVICNTKFSRKYGIEIGHSPAVGDVKKYMEDTAWESYKTKCKHLEN